MHKRPVSLAASSRAARATLSGPRRRVALALLAAALLGAGGVAWFRTPPREAVELVAATLDSDCDGAICDWLLSLTDVEAIFFQDTQAELAAKAPPGTRVHIYWGKASRRRSFEQTLRTKWGLEPDRLLWHETPNPVWPWTRDLFLAGTADDGSPVTWLHHPDHYRMSSGTWKPDEMRTYADGLPGAAAPTSGLRIDGGGVVSDAERVFVSEDYLRLMVERKDAPDVRTLIRRLESLWQRRVAAVRVGNVYVSRHCDLLLMPAGEKRVVLSNPTLGAELLASLTPTERAAFAREVRRIAHQAPPGNALRLTADADYVASFMSFGLSDAVRATTARLRKQLEVLGYTVYEIPMLAAQLQMGPEQVVLSYTNVVIDQRQGHRTVYLPTYRQPTVDRRAAEAWHALGYRVLPIDCLAPGLRGGAVRCLSQVFRGVGVPSAAPGTPLGAAPRPGS